MGAGHTAGHLLEEGLLDLHKLGGLNDIKNLFHLPQKHHLGGRDIEGSSSISPDTHLTALQKLSSPTSLWWASKPSSYLLLGAGFGPVFEQSPDHLWEVRQKGVRPARMETYLPPRGTHMLCQGGILFQELHHTICQLWGRRERRRGSRGDQDRTLEVCSLLVSTLTTDYLGCARHHAWCAGTRSSHRRNIQQTSPYKFYRSFHDKNLYHNLQEYRRRRV